MIVNNTLDMIVSNKLTDKIKQLQKQLIETSNTIKCLENENQKLYELVDIMEHPEHQERLVAL